MIVSTYPPNKGTEVGKAFIQGAAKKVPPFMKRIEVYNTSCDEGIRAYAIWEIQDEKAADGIRELTNRMVPYTQIEGYRWRLELLMKVSETLPLLGLAPPK